MLPKGLRSPGIKSIKSAATPDQALNLLRAAIDEDAQKFTVSSTRRGLREETIRSIMAAKDETGVLGGMRLPFTLLLVSDDETLSNLITGIVEPPWKLVRKSADGCSDPRMFAQPNVRLVVFDDQAVQENDRSRLLAQIRKHFSAHPLLYIAGDHSEVNEKRARTSGAHYYASKPLAHKQFGLVLQSFLQTQKFKG